MTKSYEDFLKENDPEQYEFYQSIASGESAGDVVTDHPDIESSNAGSAFESEGTKSSLIHNIIDRFSLTSRYDESKHPRGQPKNKGQYAKGSGGGTSASKSKAQPPAPTSKPSKPAKPDPKATYSKLRALIQAGELPPPADPDIKASSAGSAFGSGTDRTKTKSRFPLPNPNESWNLEKERISGIAEQIIADAVGGIRVGKVDPLTGQSKPPYDVRIHRGAKELLSNILHFIEVKYKAKGDKDTISFHPDALLRKADHAADFPKAGHHTVFIDVRDQSFNGSEKHNYRGHDLYYRRGYGEYYSTQNMYRVKDLNELKKLINTPDDQLPMAARGTVPVRDAELERKAALTQESRKRRDAGGKKQARRKRYNERKAAELAARLRAG